MYWYMNNSVIKMYTDSKELKGTKLANNGWKTYKFTSTASTEDEK